MYLILIAAIVVYFLPSKVGKVERMTITGLIVLLS